MSQEIKKCSNCQKDTNQEYYQGKKEDKEFLFCPTCWISKKEEYKKEVIEKYLPELWEKYSTPPYNNTLYDKLSFFHWKVLENQNPNAPNSWQNSMKYEGQFCWGCGEMYSDKEHKSPNCQTIIEEREELKQLQNRDDYTKGQGSIPGLPLNESEKKRLQELKNKYSKSSNNSERERERERAFWLISSNTALFQPN